ncbi:transcriptional regulator [Acrocarpospora corrugata]|uniref:Transcriptional regulator n=1 Tax=Acrocarpospora corrugata TaxID=35763 RepID=A0A5M3W5E6_9ACTN|nr:ATP-binding protein [Acrocarpospora corrugata]GES02391.1 transcriptional regulator [Acrocarpospora corrugata]
MGAMTPGVWIDVAEESAVSAVRRALTEEAVAVGLAERRVAELGIVAAEIVTNLCRHAGRGTVLVRRSGPGVEVVALDSGPGMADGVPYAADGHSTAGTLGIGLGALARLSDWTDAYSRPGGGTVYALRVGDAEPAQDAWRVAGLVRAMSGESASGDGFAVRREGPRVTIMLCDGLGHGPLAASAANAALRAFEDAPAGAPADLLTHVHKEITHTRGAAIAIAALDLAAGTLHYAGLGNIAGVLVGDRQRGLVSLPGIAGHRAVAIRAYEYPLPPRPLLVMHTDGLSQRWDLADYPGLAGRDPLVIAGALLRDRGVRRDDAGVLVAKVAS